VPPFRQSPAFRQKDVQAMIQQWDMTIFVQYFDTFTEHEHAVKVNP